MLKVFINLFKKDLNILHFFYVIIVVLSSCKNSEEVKPRYSNIEEWVFAPGQMEWDNSYQLTAQSDGVLKNAEFEVGNFVQVGNILALIDNPNNVINANSSNDQLIISK